MYLSLPRPRLSCLPPLSKTLLTCKDGRVVSIRAVGLALLSQLLVTVAAGNEGLDEEAVALPSVQVGQHDLIGVRVFLFLQTTQKKARIGYGLIHGCLRLRQ